MKGLTGKVVSIKTPETAVVQVERILVHPVFEKRIKKHKRYPVHDEVGVAVGEIVQFVGGKPFSKTKKWKVVKVIKK